MALSNSSNLMLSPSSLLMTSMPRQAAFAGFAEHPPGIDLHAGGGRNHDNSGIDRVQRPESGPTNSGLPARRAC